MPSNSIPRRFRKYFLMPPGRDDSGLCIYGGVHGYTIQEQVVMNQGCTFQLSRWDSGLHATVVSIRTLDIDIPAAMAYYKAHGYDRLSRGDDQRVAYLVLYQGYDCVGMWYTRSLTVLQPNPINDLLDKIRDIAGLSQDPELSDPSALHSMLKIEIPERFLGRFGTPVAMDLHVVHVTLKDGRKFRNLAVRGDRFISGYADNGLWGNKQRDNKELDFSSEDIAKVRKAIWWPLI